MATQLLATKLYVPPIRPGLVSRPRLIQRLSEGLNGKLTLISAPAGFGKTTLVNEWAHAVGAGQARPAQVADVSSRDAPTTILAIGRLTDRLIVAPGNLAPLVPPRSATTAVSPKN